MVKLIDYKTNITRMINGAEHNISTFVADTEDDIADMNAEGSEYLHYPAGSACLCLENGEVYILNAEETEYVILGGDNT